MLCMHACCLNMMANLNLSCNVCPTQVKIHAESIHRRNIVWDHMRLYSLQALKQRTSLALDSFCGRY